MLHGSERSGRFDTLLAGALILGIAFLLGNVLLYGHGRDQSIYAIIGDGLFDGHVPYRDLWDIKPPAIFLIYGVARLLLGHAAISIRVVEVLSLASLVWAFAILSQRLAGDRRAGILGAALGLLSYAQLEFWHTAQPEGFGGVLVAWAVVCATPIADFAPRRAGTRRRLWLACGALYGAAGLLKPPLAGGLLVSLWVARARSKSPEGARGWRSAAALALMGAAIPVLITLAYFAAAGGLPQLVETLFVFAPRYTRLDFDTGWTLELIYRAVEQWLFWFSPFTSVGLACFFLLPPLAPREKEGALHVLGIVLIQLLGVALQGKFIPYHYAGTLPFAGLLAGWGLWKVWIRARGRALAAAAFTALLVALAALVTPTQMEEGPSYYYWSRCADRLRALASPGARSGMNDRLGSHYDMDAVANREVSEWIREHTAGGSAIFVWGFEPSIYEMSGRRPASRYIQNQPLRAAWSRDAARRLLMEDLRRSAPQVIVVQHNDVFRLVTGDDQDSAAALSGFPELVDWIRSGYAPGDIIEDFEIYVRRSP